MPQPSPDSFSLAFAPKPPNRTVARRELLTGRPLARLSSNARKHGSCWQEFARVLEYVQKARRDIEEGLIAVEAPKALACR